MKTGDVCQTDTPFHLCMHRHTSIYLQDVLDMRYVRLMYSRLLSVRSDTSVRVGGCACPHDRIVYATGHFSTSNTQLLILLPAVGTWLTGLPCSSRECLVCSSTGKPQLPTYSHKHTRSHTPWNKPTPLSRQREGLTPKEEWFKFLS